MRTRTHTPRVIDISTCLNYFESIYSYTCFGSRANHILRRFAIGTTISLQMLWQFDHQVVRTLSGMRSQPAWRITEVYRNDHVNIAGPTEPYLHLASAPTQISTCKTALEQMKSLSKMWLKETDQTRLINKDQTRLIAYESIRLRTLEANSRHKAQCSSRTEDLTALTVVQEKPWLAEAPVRVMATRRSPRLLAMKKTYTEL